MTDLHRKCHILNMFGYCLGSHLLIKCAIRRDASLSGWFITSAHRFSGGNPVHYTITFSHSAYNEFSEVSWVKFVSSVSVVFVHLTADSFKIIRKFLKKIVKWVNKVCHSMGVVWVCGELCFLIGTRMCEERKGILSNEGYRWKLQYDRFHCRRPGDYTRDPTVGETSFFFFFFK